MLGPAKAANSSDAADTSKLSLDVVFQCQPGAASADETGSDDGVAGLLRLLKGADSEQERTVIFDVATSQTELYLTGEQARSVFDAAHCERSAVEKVAMLLPHVVAAQVFVQQRNISVFVINLGSYFEIEWGIC